MCKQARTAIKNDAGREHGLDPLARTGVDGRPDEYQSYGFIAASNASGSKSNARSKLESGSELPGLFESVFCRCCCDWRFVSTCTRGGRNGRFTAAECCAFEDEVDAGANKAALRVIPSARRGPCEDDNSS